MATAKTAAAASEKEKEDAFTCAKLTSLSKDDKSEIFDLCANYNQWSNALKARIFGDADKDGNYFSYMFLDKMFGRSRACSYCRMYNSARIPGLKSAMHLYVIEGGIIGKHNVECNNCNMVEEVVSGDDPSMLPTDPRLEISGDDLKEMCKKITHYEILHDLMEMLQIAATEDNVPRKEKHHAIAAFMVRNARKVCEEWCRPENADLRQRKFLRLREETLLTQDKPMLTLEMMGEYHEMYDLMAQSFLQNRDQLMQMLYLIKAQLIDNPCRSTFMTWVGIAMMQSENYPEFKRLHDPRCCMKMEANDFQSLKEQYLTLDVPLGIKKIPVVFVLFEIPRFFHYAEFLNQRLGRKRARFVLTDKDREELELVKIEEECLRLGREVRKRKKKTMICPEAHLTYLSQQEEDDRERLYQTYRDRKQKTCDPFESTPEARTCSPAGDLPVQNGLEPEPTKTELVRGEASGGRNWNGETESELGISLTKAQIKRRKKKAMFDQRAMLECVVEEISKCPPMSKEALSKVSETAMEAEKEELISDPLLPYDLAQSYFASSKKKKSQLNVPDESAKMEQFLSEPAKSVMEEEWTSVGDLKFTSRDMEYIRVVTNTSEAGISNFVVTDEASSRVAKTLTDCSLDGPESEPGMSKSPSKTVSNVSKSEDVSQSASDPSKFASLGSKSLSGVKMSVSTSVPASGAPKFVIKCSSDVPKSVSKSASGSASAASKSTISEKEKSVSVMSKPSKFGYRGSKFHGSRSSSSLAKCTQGMRTVRTLSGIMESVPEMPEGSSSASLSTAGASTRKIIMTRGDMPIILGNEAYEVYKKGGKDCPLKILTADPKNPKLSDDQIDSLMTDLSSLSYPVLAGLIDSYGSSKEEEDNTDEDLQQTPKSNKSISILSDTFCITKKPKRIPKGAVIYFMREDAERNLKDNASNPKWRSKGKSMAEDISGRLFELMRNSFRDEQDVTREFDFDFQAVGFHDLPSFLQSMLSIENIGSHLEKKTLSAEEYCKVLAFTKIYGKKISYGPSEPVNYLTMMCLPMELNLAEGAADSLSRDLFGAVDIDRPLWSRGESSNSASGMDLSIMGGAGIKSSNVPVPKSRNASRRAQKEAIRSAKKALQNPSDQRLLTVTLMDAYSLRMQGHKVNTDAKMVTVLANKEGVIFHIIEDGRTPEQVKDYLSKKYNLTSEQQGPGYYTVPIKDHLGDLLMDPQMAATEEVLKDKIPVNRKKLKSREKAIQDIHQSSLHHWSGAKPKNPYAERLGEWISSGSDWPEGLPFGTEDFGDREVLSGRADRELVSVLDHDCYGNHSMMKRLELSTVDAANEQAAETVIKRYMEEEHNNPPSDQKVPRYIIPPQGSPLSARKLPIGTKREDVPILMKYAAPHKQMRALDAMKVPYKYELTQVLTPHLNDNGYVVPDAPKRIAILSRISVLAKSKFDSKQFHDERQSKEEKDDRLKKRMKPGIEERERLRVAREREKKEDRELRKEREMEKQREREQDELNGNAGPSKAKRKKLRKRMKILKEATTNTESKGEGPGGSSDHSSMVSGRQDYTQVDDADVEMESDSKDGCEDSESSDEDSRSFVIARDKFRCCNSCGKKITTRIMLCAGCKKVAYCNFSCQKASWKVHKKVCLYALRKDGKDSTG